MFRWVFKSVLALSVLGSSAKASVCQVISDSMKMGTSSIEASDYQNRIQVCKSNPKNSDSFVSLRSFSWRGEDWFLMVNPADLKTSLASAACFQQCREVHATELPGLYGSILNSEVKYPAPMHDDGITQSHLVRQQLFLTVDLCPSHKSLDSSFFQGLMEHRSSFPVSISLSGGWMRGHREELNWLKEAQRQGKLQITWMNHTDTHPYHPGIPWERNFILSPGENLTREVLGAEIEFLKNGLIPPVFFRFPGLVSNEEKMLELRSLGLIPMGASAWLARGEKIQDGGVILVHANGNEPLGLKLFFQDMLDTNDWGLFRNLMNLFF